MDDLLLLAIIGGAAAAGLLISWLLGVVLPARRKAASRPEEISALDDTLLANHREPLRYLQDVRTKVRAKIKNDSTAVPDILDYVIVQSHNLGASDVHVTPMPSSINIEIRLDGLLYGVAVIPKEHQDVLFRRLKVLARLDVFARDKPQDGHIAEIAGQVVDIRISTLPVAYGEKAVLRLLSKSSGQLDLDQLGLTEDRLARYREVTERTQGLIVLTGPTGSGKTTTMYASLRELKDRRRASLNIVTIEDPIETEIPILNQTQVNEATGLTFAKGLRSILRQDPDVIMVGEIRDAETAQIATQAGLTGHLIFTSIHADSAAGVFNRLINMGIEPFLVASSTAAILSQRLVRRLCPHCRQPAAPADHHRQQLERMGVTLGGEAEFWAGAGCESCLGKGDQGRIGLFELLVVDDAIRTELVKQVPTRQLAALATSQGMQTLLDDGLTKARRGDVSLAEVLRVVV
jgi:type II secretory ATPase GspE/PulE/Tfp pilus assembly ATPase PilB-like protein